MAGETYCTTEPEVIRQWAEARNGQPALIPGNGAQTSTPCIIFPEINYSESYTVISWPDLFQKIAQDNMALLYQEKTTSGEISQFNRFVLADSSDALRSAAPSSSHAPLSEAHGIYQTDEQQSPLAQGTMTRQSPGRTRTLTGRIIILSLILVLIIAALLTFGVYWPSQ